MKQITPIDQANNGLLSTTLRVGILDDNLETFCSFSWWLFTEEGTLVNTGTIRCDQEDYSNWDGSNEYPYTFIAGKLGVQIIGNIS